MTLRSRGDGGMEPLAQQRRNRPPLAGGNLDDSFGHLPLHEKRRKEAFGH